MADFNPPPTWPEPPPGWQPPRGWLPDPAWPEPPPGWQLWLDDACARRDRRAASRRTAGRPGPRLATGLTGALAALGAAVVLASSPQPAHHLAMPTTSTAGLGTTTVLAPAPLPTAPPLLTMGCPTAGGGGRRFAATFTHDVTLAAPFTVTIDYGDGHSYRGDDAHLGAVFSHTYTRHGSFTVSATVSDEQGRTGTATCTTTWSPG